MYYCAHSRYLVSTGRANIEETNSFGYDIGQMGTTLLYVYYKTVIKQETGMGGL